MARVVLRCYKGDGNLCSKKDLFKVDIKMLSIDYVGITRSMTHIERSGRADNRYPRLSIRKHKNEGSNSHYVTNVLVNETSDFFFLWTLK